ncbi:MAG: response regulator [Candidatus Altiarchaeota archaeon]
MNETILVVDNEEDICTLIKEVLDLDGYNVLTAFSGSECIESAGKNKIDLIILDVMMPDMDGWETLDKMIELDVIGDAKILVCTVAKDYKKQMEKYGEHVQGQLDKSNLIVEIRQKVGEIL